MTETRKVIRAADLRSVDELADAYARILESMWSMKRFGRMNALYAAFDSDLDTKLVKRLGWPGLLVWPLRLPFIPIRGWWRSFVLRPAVSIYAETHVHSSASKLSGVLTRERLKRTLEHGPEIESLERSIATLEWLKNTTTGWVTLMIVLRFVPLIGILFSMGIVTVSFTLNDAPGVILQLIGILPLIVLLIHPVVVQFGFRWKRALFAGGGSTGGRGESDDGPGLPTTNTYDIEQRTYLQLGIKRSTELPADLFMAPGIYFLFNLITGIVFRGNLLEASEPSFEGDRPLSELIAGAIIAGVFIVFLAIATIRLVLRYKLRRASGYF